MFKFAIPAVAALALIAVAAQSQATGSVPTEADLQAAKAETPAVQSMGWHLSHEGATAKLAYGIANSDQLALMLICEPGQTQAVVYGDIAPVTPRLTKAVAGGSIDPFTGGLMEDVKISLGDPAIRSLVRDGKMPVKGDAGDFELKATADERRVIGDFVSYCAKGRA